MEQPYRFKKKLLKMGGSSCVVIPSINGWKIADRENVEVILEVYADKIVITKAGKK